MGGSHGQEDGDQDDRDPSWFDSKFSALASQIDSMGREMEQMRELYNIQEWTSSSAKRIRLENGVPERMFQSLGPGMMVTSTPSRKVPDISVLNESSASLYNSEENSNMSFVGNMPSLLFDGGDSNSSFILNDSLIDKINNKEAKRQRLVMKLRRITKKYFIVNKLAIKDNKMKKLYLDYEQDRYFFIHYVNDLPKTYQCKQCPKIFNKITSLQWHKRTHTKMPQGYNIGDFARRFSNHAAPVEPYIPAAHNKLTENLRPHPTQYPGYVDLRTTAGLPSLKPGASVAWGGDSFSVGELIGEGGFARVFGAVWDNGPLEERDTVLKIQSPANDWEWYILNQMRWRYEALQHPLTSSSSWSDAFMFSPRCYTFSGGAVLISRRQKLGTLLDMINIVKNTDKNLVESLAIYIMADILGMMDILHKLEIVHADLKPDNFLMLHTPGTQALPCLQLIDFGKSVDLTLTCDNKENVDTNLETIKEEAMDCEMKEEEDEDLTEDEKEQIEIEKNEREVEELQNALFTELGRAGQFHLDLYGIAGCAYCLLFGKYIEVGTVKNRWVVKGNFQRRWQTKLWLQFFDNFLNPHRDQNMLPDLIKWREKLLDLYNKEEDLREGLKKAQEVIQTKLVDKLRKNL